MPRNYTVKLDAGCWTGDVAPIVSGDKPAAPVAHLGRHGWAFDAGSDEEAIVSREFAVPAEHTGTGTLKADVYFAMASAASGSVQLDVRVEAITPNSDTLDLEAASSFSTANTASLALSGTAGDLKRLTVTLTNGDSLAAGDLLRLLIRRDTPSANDTATGDLFIYHVELYEETA